VTTKPEDAEATPTRQPMLAAWRFVTVFGIQESTLRAVVAVLVAPPRRATAYGLFAAGLGAATAAGGALTGWLYDTSIPALVVTVAVIQIAAIGLAITVIARRRPGPARS
jgi:MFS family permease